MSALLDALDQVELPNPSLELPHPEGGKPHRAGEGEKA